MVTIIYVTLLYLPLLQADNYRVNGPLRDAHILVIEEKLIKTFPVISISGQRRPSIPGVPDWGGDCEGKRFYIIPFNRNLEQTAAVGLCFHSVNTIPPGAALKLLPNKGQRKAGKEGGGRTS